jgi:hypothetical protein
MSDQMVLIGFTKKISIGEIIFEDVYDIRIFENKVMFAHDGGNVPPPKQAKTTQVNKVNKVNKEELGKRDLREARFSNDMDSSYLAKKMPKRRDSRNKTDIRLKYELEKDLNKIHDDIVKSHQSS